MVFPAVVVLVEVRVRRAWGGGGLSVGGRERERDFLKRYEVGRQAMKVNQSVSLSRVSPLCSEEGQAFNSLFSLHSHHAVLYFCDLSRISPLCSEENQAFIESLFPTFPSCRSLLYGTSETTAVLPSPKTPTNM